MRAPRRLFLCLGLALGFAGCVDLARPGPRPNRDWAHARSDLKPDPAVVWGRLENGLRYAILPQASPLRRATLTLLVQAGSFHEENGELGYAHLVEHMAFRELRDFPGDSAQTRLALLGVGPHANAYTTPFDTRYFFPDLPTDEPGAIDTGLRILRAMADGISFEPGSVERERGVVLSEQRSNQGTVPQARADELEFLPPREEELRWPEVSSTLHGTRLAERHPLGSEKSVARATSARLRRFYERWYRPDRMILAISGDVVPADLEARVRDVFSTLRPRRSEPAEPALPAPANPGFFEIFPRESDPSAHLSLAVVRAKAPEDSAASRRRTLARKLALAMLARRFSQQADAPEPPFVDTDVLASHLVPGRELILLRATTRPTAWRKAMLAMDYEVRRVNELGFDPVELALAGKVERAHVEAAARQARYERSATLATTLAYSIARGVVFTSPTDDRALTLQHLDAIDVKECHAEFRGMLLSGEWSASLMGPMGPDGGKPVALNFKESRTRPLQPYEAPRMPPPFPFVDFGPPGEILARERVEPLEIDTYRFANGVRLNLKRTSFEPGRARVEIRLAGGRLACPPDRPGLDWRSFGWLFGGIEGLSPEDLSNMMAGTLEGFQYSVTSTGIGLQAQLDADRLPLLLQATAAFITRPAFREEGFQRSLAIARQVTAPHLSTAPGAALIATWDLMSGHHHAYRPTRPEDLGQHTVEQLRAWFGPLLKTAPLEIGVIGDFDPAVVLEACAQTLGALPSRAPGDPFAALRTHPTAAPTRRSVTFAGPAALAVVALAWPTPDAVAFPTRFHAHLVRSILLARISQKLRNEMGETYSPRASFELEEGITPAVAFLSCQIETAPARSQTVAQIARDVVAALHTGGATADELEAARAPLVRSTESGLRQNEWWLDVVTLAQSHPAHGLGWAQALESYRSATLAEVNDFIRRALDPSRLTEVVALPAESSPPANRP